MKQTEVLIVGQGIAGSLIAFMLYQQGVSFLVLDAGYANTASRVAAGMFTPISGKRKTINAEMLQQIPFAVETYRQIETILHKKFLHLLNIYYLASSVEEQQEFITKQSDVLFAKYLLANPISIPDIKQQHGVFEITNSGWVDCALFTNSFKDWLIQNDEYIEDMFNYDELKIKTDKIQYKNIECKKIIFCEGYRAIDNPFFKDEAIIPCKGDVLTIEYKNFETNTIIKKNGAYLISLSNNQLKAGSTYKWNNKDETPDALGKTEIEDKLDSILENKYTILQHQSAIRPTTKNREVIARQHSTYSNVFQLNGFGTKGIIQGPIWAKHIVDTLINGG